MKKLLSIVLSIAMLASMTAGLHLTAFAAVSGIQLETAERYTVYNGFRTDEREEENSEHEMVHYTRYQIGSYSLMEEGNILTVSYDGADDKVFTCKMVYNEKM